MQSGGDRPVLLDDVARMSGVSRAAASRALSGKPGVADDVRERVRLIAERLDYRPNRAAKNLAGAPTGLIALLLGDIDLYRNPYSARLVDAIAKAATKYDQGLLIVMLEREPAHAVSNLIRDQIVDGVLVSSAVCGESWAEHLLDSEMRTVLYGAHPFRSDQPTVRMLNRNAASILVGHLLDTGCSRVGLVAGPPTQVDVVERLAGYHDAHAERGLQASLELIQPGVFDFPSGYRAALALIDIGADAIFAMNDLQATGVVMACEDRGISIPDEMSVAGFDGASEVRTSRHDLTTIVQPFDEMARRAVKLLLEPSLIDVVFQGELHVGSTTR